MEEDDNNFISQSKNIDKKKEENNLSFHEISQLVQSLKWNLINVNRLDYYSNTIPIGAFCNAVAFILYGFKLCHVFNSDKSDTFLDGVILIFGGLGQITTGILEFIKVRTFPCMVYFAYGFFCLSLYFIKSNIFDNITSTNKDLSTFYGAWMIISIPITISSIRVNLLYIIQTLLTTAFFVLEVFGEGLDEKKAKENTAGIILAISGFFSLYIFLTQMVNQALNFPLLPAIPIKPNNEVDITQDYRGYYIN